MQSETPGPKERLTKTAGVFLIENKLHGNPIFFFSSTFPFHFPFVSTICLRNVAFPLIRHDEPYRLLNSQLTKTLPKLLEKSAFFFGGFIFQPLASPSNIPRGCARPDGDVSIAGGLPLRGFAEALLALLTPSFIRLKMAGARSEARGPRNKNPRTSRLDPRSS
jgi:hypothetical protein